MRDGGFPGQKFCGECGAALAVAARPGVFAPAAGPVAERRVCSVLFCDVVGFTPLSEARDPEAVRELLSQYFDVARMVVGRYALLLAGLFAAPIAAASLFLPASRRPWRAEEHWRWIGRLTVAVAFTAVVV